MAITITPNRLINDAIISTFNDKTRKDENLEKVKQYFISQGFVPPRTPYEDAETPDGWAYRTVNLLIDSASKSIVQGQIYAMQSAIAPHKSVGFDIVKFLRASEAFDTTMQSGPDWTGMGDVWLTNPVKMETPPDPNFFKQVNDLVGIEVPSTDLITVFDNNYKQTEELNQFISESNNAILLQASQGVPAKDISVNAPNDYTAVNYTIWLKTSGFKDAYSKPLPSGSASFATVYPYK